MNNIKKIWYKKLTFTFFHKINTVLILTRFTIFLSLLKMLQVLDVHCFCGSLFRVIGILFEDVKYFSFVAHNVLMVFIFPLTVLTYIYFRSSNRLFYKNQFKIFTSHPYYFNLIFNFIFQLCKKKSYPITLTLVISLV